LSAALRCADGRARHRGSYPPPIIGPSGALMPGRLASPGSGARPAAARAGSLIRRRCSGLPRLAAAAAEAQLLGQRRALLGIGRRGQRVVDRQAPTLQILLAAQPMARAQMPAQHLALPATIETDDGVALHR